MNRSSVAIDYLRAFVTVLVVAFHSAIAYAAFVPAVRGAFASKPYYWAPFPIVDSQRWTGFDFFIFFNDAYFMALMFLLAGLFVWPGLQRKGGLLYLRDRMMRLGVPFVIVGVLLIPFAYLPAYLARGGMADPGTFLRQWLGLDSWPSGPCWFIAALLSFDLLAVLLRKIAPSAIDALGAASSGASIHPVRFFFGMLGVSLVAYLSMRFAFGPTRWLTAGPFAIQASRVLLYLTYFFAGVGIGAWGIERGLLSREGRLASRWAVWLAAALVAFLSLAILEFLQKQAGTTATLGLKGLAGIGFAVSCAASSFCMLAVFSRFATRRIRVLDNLCANAYGIFLIHYFFVSWIQYALLDVALPATAKGAIVFFATLAMSWGAVAMLRKLALVDRILANGTLMRNTVPR
jgi:hypothetical protein